MSRRSSGIFDSTSKSLGVALLDYDHDGWPDLLIANDTQPNKLYRNLRNGTFEDVAVRAGVAFSEDGKARAGHGRGRGRFRQLRQHGASRSPTSTTRWWRCTSLPPGGTYKDVGAARRRRTALAQQLWASAARSSISNLDGHLDLVAANGHIDETVRQIHGNVGYAQPPHLFLNDGKGNFRDVAAQAGSRVRAPESGAGAGLWRFRPRRRHDLLMTTNGGGALLIRNDLPDGEPVACGCD